MPDCRFWRIGLARSRTANVSTMTLTLLPAVDVANGQAVRLVQGRADRETQYGPPMDAARAWVEQGAQWLHLVDLDAAFGRGSNAAVIEHVVADLRGQVHIELSGGIRDDASLDHALRTGCARVNLGTAALEDPEWTERVIAEHGERIAVSLDVRGHTLAARGWTSEGGDLWETLGRLDVAGCPRYVVTDVKKDGTMHGPNLHLLKEVCAATDRPVIASGGIAKLEDLHKLTAMTAEGIEGAIIGRALYDGAFTLTEAFAAIEPRFDPYEYGPAQP
jgi:1-(5-phosphoribosyl)-5-[(5-phosphoribosylamino)methylideneamino] imidazole-4-carboxamide isomerase/N-(5'phosphoribosyl)anthranilate isomerase